MSSDYGFISVRIDSTRLPCKCLLTLGNGMSVLGFIIERCKIAGIVPIVCSDELSFKQAINVEATNYGALCFWGAKENKIKRWFHIARTVNASKFHTIDCDDPFFDPARVKVSLRKLTSNLHYVAPSQYSDNGGATEGYSFLADDLERFCALSDDFDTSFIPPHLTYLERIKLDDPSYVLKQSRLTLDYLGDYVYLRSLSEKFGPECSRQTVEEYINTEDKFDNIELNNLWLKKQIEEGRSID